MTTAEQLWAGRTIQYLGVGMRTVQQYTFGCFDDWIDLTAVGVLTPVCSVVEGVHRAAENANLLPPGCDPTFVDAVQVGRVYYFPDQVKRVSDRSAPAVAQALVGSYWFVTQGELNTRIVPGSNLAQELSELFGTGVFKYDTDIVDPLQRYTYGVAGSMQLTKSDRDSATLAGSNKAQGLTPGCDENIGNLKSSCNLVCFDVVRGLLSPGVGTAKLLIHHISVAEFANTTESVSANTYVSARRRLLETVTPFGGMQALGESTMPAGIQSIIVEADPRDADAEIVEDTDAATQAAAAATSNVTIAVEDDDDESELSAGAIVGIAFGIVGVSAVVFATVVCTKMKTNKRSDIFETKEELLEYEQQAYRNNLLHRRGDGKYSSKY
jgi:hypothetical protein